MDKNKAEEVIKGKAKEMPKTMDGIVDFCNRGAVFAQSLSITLSLLSDLTESGSKLSRNWQEEVHGKQSKTGKKSESGG